MTRHKVPLNAGARMIAVPCREHPGLHRWQLPGVAVKRPVACAAAMGLTRHSCLRPFLAHRSCRLWRTKGRAGHTLLELSELPVRRAVRRLIAQVRSAAETFLPAHGRIWRGGVITFPVRDQRHRWSRGFPSLQCALVPRRGTSGGPGGVACLTRHFWFGIQNSRFGMMPGLVVAAGPDGGVACLG